MVLSRSLTGNNHLVYEGICVLLQVTKSVHPDAVMGLLFGPLNVTKFVSYVKVLLRLIERLFNLPIKILLLFLYPPGHLFGISEGAT